MKVKEVLSSKKKDAKKSGKDKKSEGCDHETDKSDKKVAASSFWDKMKKTGKKES